MKKPDERNIGLYDKFLVKRTDGKHRAGQKHHRCRYVVLDVTHDKNAAPALRAYANAVDEDGFHALAKDLHDLAFQLENAMRL
jgi:hypothetical protein